MSFNSRAVYQRYMGWYDANPVHLTPLDPADEAARYVAMMGGAERVRAAAQTAYDQGDDRWAGELLNRLVYADAKDNAARALLAKVYDRQGRGGRERDLAQHVPGRRAELRDGVRAVPPARRRRGAAQHAHAMLLDLLSVRLDPEKAKDGRVSVDLVFPDRKERFRVAVRNDVLTYEAGRRPARPTRRSPCRGRSSWPAPLPAPTSPPPPRRATGQR
jgi:alkyl sulfatase BDS1-like metallo-beta-lactamase superfamily hydrolase